MLFQLRLLALTNFLRLFISVPETAIDFLRGRILESIDGLVQFQCLGLDFLTSVKVFLEG